MTTRVRLDTLLVERGLAESREKARALVMAGQVEVDDRGAHKAGMLVNQAARLRVIGPDHPWVSRGGLKLAHALDACRIDVAGRLALDIGASTGGFTDVLLQRGARHVIALDVGHGQLHWKIRTDPRVTVVEGVNARYLSRETLAAFAPLGNGVDLVTIDVSFISLAHIFPVLPPLLAPGASIVALVKPQFEAGRRDVGKKGIVTDPAVHQRVLDSATAAATGVGLSAVVTLESPITGAEGNKEFLMVLARQDSDAAAGHPSEGRSD